MIDLVKIREHADYCKTVHASDSRPYALASEVESLLSEVERLNRELAVKDEHRDEVRKALGLRDTVGTITGARLVIESRDNAKRERNELLAKCEDATRAVERITNERDALREHSNNIRSALNLADGSDAVLCAKLITDERAKISELLGIAIPKLGELPQSTLVAVDAIRAELDELRTRHARLVDSTDTFVAALVDERFKKDHAAMLAELHELRTKDIEASKRLRIEINAMPETTRAIFESARVEAKLKGVPIVRALVDMVANARQSSSTLRSQRDDALRGNGISYIENEQLRDECRQHLARINVLDSLTSAMNAEAAQYRQEANALRNQPVTPIPMILHCQSCKARHIDEGEFATKPHHTHACQSCGFVWRPAIVATVGVQFLPGFKNEPITDDALVRAVKWANEQTKRTPTDTDVAAAMVCLDYARMVPGPWAGHVREFVTAWTEGRAPDDPQSIPANDGAAPIGIGVTPRD